jgi:hypothetical protein
MYSIFPQKVISILWIRRGNYVFLIDKNIKYHAHFGKGGG